MVFAEPRLEHFPLNNACKRCVIGDVLWSCAGSTRKAPRWGWGTAIYGGSRGYAFLGHDLAPVFDAMLAKAFHLCECASASKGDPTPMRIKGLICLYEFRFRWGPGSAPLGTPSRCSFS
jgi:hypothetical protein